MNEKLKILLMTPWLEYFLGAETHFYAVANELIRLGHDVSVFCFLKDEMWKVMKRTGANMIDDIKDEYDVVIMNGNVCFPKAPKFAYKIFISNGVIPPQEYPIHGVDRYVAVSEEIAEVVKSKGFRPILIRNGVDCDRFKLTKLINKKLKNVLLLSNKQNPRSGEFLIIDEVCRDMKLRLMVCGLMFGTSTFEVEEMINENDLVISLGRGIYEAMACGRNAIIADYQGIDGFVDRKLYLKARKNNCSGRRYNTKMTRQNLRESLEKYSQKQGEENGKIILKEQDIKKTVQNLLDLYYYRDLNV